MPQDKADPKAIAVPASRLNRFVQLGGLATRIAGNMAAGGVAQPARGRRPSISVLLLTPANARKVADQLAKMR